VSADTVPDLAPRAGELVVRKRGYDAFAGTPLDGALRARNVTSLVVTGTMTDICVLATVIGALHRQRGRGRRGDALARDPAGHPRHHRAGLRPGRHEQGNRRADLAVVRRL